MTPDTPHTSTVARPRVAVLGATGLVGREMTRLLAERDFPCSSLRLLASPRSAGTRLPFGDGELEVEPASPAVLAEQDLVLASAGGTVSREWLPDAAAAGAICVDNTSAFRMDPEVPLVVPEVNSGALKDIALGRGGAIVANPNCSTIQLVVALRPLQEEFGIERVVVSTYQSLSGAGSAAVERFREGSAAVLAGAERAAPAGAEPIFDVLPWIGEIEPDGHTTEERKMMDESVKILGEPIPLDVTCVRVPVFVGHAEAVAVQTRTRAEPRDVLAVLGKAPGIHVVDDAPPPTPASSAGTHAVHVGRVRPSAAFERGIQLWISADNLLKGAAWNAVQIAERLID